MRIDNKVTVAVGSAIMWVLITPILICAVAAYYTDRLTSRIWNSLVKKPNPDEWSRWFAWYPVECKDGGWQWLQTVYRKPWVFHEIVEYRLAMPVSNESNVGKSDE